MDVSVIIVSYNTKKLTKDCLLSIYEKTKDLDFEIFVVDNNSSDGSVEMLEQDFPKIKLIINKENRGFGAANNIAIRQSEAKYVFLLNPDTVLLNNAIKILYDYMENNSDVGACGGNLYDKNLNEVHAGGRFPSVLEIIFNHMKLKHVFKSYYEKNLKDGISPRTDIKAVDQIIGADLFIKKSVLDEVGLFDEKFFMYYEEIDLEYRITKKGYKIMFIPESKIIHLEGQSNNNNLKKRKMYKKSQFYYFRKHYGFCVELVVKVIYLILYFFEWLIYRKSDTLKIIDFIIRGEK